jgi:hypothetical protein
MRFTEVCKAAALLMRQGEHVFSLIAHTHPIALAGELPTGWDYWREFDELFFRICDEMRILALPGWRESRGIAAEIEVARSMGLPIFVMEWPSGALSELSKDETPNKT